MFNSLIIQTAFLGDLLLGIPLFKSVRELHPDGRLTVLCRRGLGSFLLATGLVDEVIEVDKKSKQEWSNAKSKLLETEFDLILCPHESLRSALLVLSLRGKKKIGFRSWFNGFIFDERVERPMEDPEAVRQLSLLKSESIRIAQMISSFEAMQQRSGGRFTDGSLVSVPRQFEMTIPSLVELRKCFKLGENWRKSLGESVLTLDNEIDFKLKPMAVLAPGSVWATKMWTSEGFVAVGKKLSQEGYKVLVTGSKDEATLCGEVARSIEGAVSLAGRTGLFESAQILAMSDILICNDSGAMHLGACSGVPTVSVFGPTVLDFGYRPWNDRAEVVQLDLDCRPCGTHGAKRCPLGTHACMKGIGAQAVLARIENLRSN